MIQQMSFLNPASTSESPQFIYCWTLAWRILSMTLLACEMSTNHLVILLKCRFWSSWSGVGTEILHLLEAPRWCWCCWLENCTFSNKTLAVLLSLMLICISRNSCSYRVSHWGPFQAWLLHVNNIVLLFFLRRSSSSGKWPFQFVSLWVITSVCITGGESAVCRNHSDIKWHLTDT